MQNSAFSGMAPGVAQGLGGIYGTTSGNAGQSFGLAPWMVNGLSSSDAGNPLIAPMTSGQQYMLGRIGENAQTGFGGLTNAQGMAREMMDPNSGLVSNAINMATNPMINAFNQFTMPSLRGNFTAMGHRLSAPEAMANANTGSGSSAFENARNNAISNLQQNIGQVSGQIEQNFLNTGLQATAQLSQENLNQMISSLQQEALPQMLQQYGINQGMQLYQQQIQTILSALGVGAQAAQPAIGNVAGSHGSNTGGLGGLIGAQGLGGLIGEAAGEDTAGSGILGLIGLL